MNFVESIEDFFDLIVNYINTLADYLYDSDLNDLLLYLWQCFPDFVRTIIIFVVLLSLLIGFMRGFKST